MRKWPYLNSGTPNLKNKGTSISSTFKVEEKKVPLFFGFGASGLRYSHFVIFRIALTKRQTKKMRKWPYLRPEAPNPKNKDTLFSPTFKVVEKKVPLFFGFGTSGLRYSHFVIFMIALTRSQIKKMRKWPYLSPEAPNKKIRHFLFFNFKIWRKESTFIF